MGDPIMKILFVAGLLTLIVGVLNNGAAGAYEGGSIIAAVVMIVLFTSLNDLMKARQFQKLEEVVKE